MRENMSARAGQKIRTETSADKGSFKMDNKQSLNGKEMGGGTSNLSHSISGSANQGYQTSKK